MRRTLSEGMRDIGGWITPTGEYLDVDDWRGAHADSLVEIIEQRDPALYKEMKAAFAFPRDMVDYANDNEHSVTRWGIENGYIRTLYASGRNRTEYVIDFSNNATRRAKRTAALTIKDTDADIYMINGRPYMDQNNAYKATLGTLNENRGVAKHKKFGDLDLSIEIPAGSYRFGTNHQGEEWSQKMNSHYGYIKLTGAPDGDHLDCYLRKKPKNDSKIFVIHQLRPDGSEYDEDKVMLGFSSANEAKKEWRLHAFKPNKMFGAMSEWDPEHFKHVVHACRNSNACMARDHVYDKLCDMNVLQRNIKRPKDVLSKLSENRRGGMKKLTECKDLNEAFSQLNEADLSVETKPYDQVLRRAGYERHGGGAQGGWMTYRNGPYTVMLQLHPFGKVIGWFLQYKGDEMKRGRSADELQDALQSKVGEDSSYVDAVMESLSLNLQEYDLFEKDARRYELNRMDEWQLYRLYSRLSEDIGDLSVMNKSAVIEQILTMEGF